MPLSPEAEARIDAKIAQYRKWQDEGRCYACGVVATHRVSLPWMRPARLYCGPDARSWGNAGFERFVAPLAPST